MAEGRLRSVTDACAAAGLDAPDNLAVIGADDIPTARLSTPPLTTVHFDLHQVGKQHAQAVVAGLSGDDSQPTFVPIIPRLVQRAST